MRNQWVARGRTWLIDWESLVLAPRERDLATLVHEGRDVDHDPRMLRLFDLEWRLGEIWSFAQWLRGPHAGDADDRTALGGLTEELTATPLRRTLSFHTKTGASPPKFRG